MVRIYNLSNDFFFFYFKNTPETTELLNVIGDDHEKRNLPIWQANLRYQTENLPTAEKENITCMFGVRRLTSATRAAFY